MEPSLWTSLGLAHHTARTLPPTGGAASALSTVRPGTSYSLLCATVSSSVKCGSNSNNCRLGLFETKQVSVYKGRRRVPGTWNLMGWIDGWDHSLQAGHHVPVQIVNAHSYVYMLPLVPATHTHPSTGTHVNPTHPKGQRSY